MVIMAIIVMNMKIMEIDQSRHPTMEYQTMDPSPNLQGTIIKAKIDGV